MIEKILTKNLLKQIRVFDINPNKYNKHEVIRFGRLRSISKDQSKNQFILIAQIKKKITLLGSKFKQKNQRFLKIYFSYSNCCHINL